MDLRRRVGLVGPPRPSVRALTPCDPTPGRVRQRQKPKFSDPALSAWEAERFGHLYRNRAQYESISRANHRARRETCSIDAELVAFGIGHHGEVVVLILFGAQMNAPKVCSRATSASTWRRRVSADTSPAALIRTIRGHFLAHRASPPSRITALFGSNSALDGLQRLHAACGGTDPAGLAR